MNQQRPPLALTPEELAFAANQQAAQMKAFIADVNASTASQLYSMLLDKWLDQNEFSKPTANDLRWLAKIAAHYAPFMAEALGMIKIQDAKLDDLDGISEDNLLNFEHLMSIHKPIESSL